MLTPPNEDEPGSYKYDGLEWAEIRCEGTRKASQEPRSL